MLFSTWFHCIWIYYATKSEITEPCGGSVFKWIVIVLSYVLWNNELHFGYCRHVHNRLGHTHISFPFCVLYFPPSSFPVYFYYFEEYYCLPNIQLIYIITDNVQRSLLSTSSHAFVIFGLWRQFHCLRWDICCFNCATVMINGAQYFFMYLHFPSQVSTYIVYLKKHLLLKF